MGKMAVLIYLSLSLDVHRCRQYLWLGSADLDDLSSHAHVEKGVELRVWVLGHLIEHAPFRILGGHVGLGCGVVPRKNTSNNVEGEVKSFLIGVLLAGEDPEVVGVHVSTEDVFTAVDDGEACVVGGDDSVVNFALGRCWLEELDVQLGASILDLHGLPGDGIPSVKGVPGLVEHLNETRVAIDEGVVDVDAVGAELKPVSGVPDGFPPTASVIFSAERVKSADLFGAASESVSGLCGGSQNSSEGELVHILIN